MKNKLIIFIFVFILVVLSLLFFVLKKNNKEQFCTATIYSEFNIPNDYSSYRVDMKIAKTSSESGYISLLGTIQSDKNYSINRIIYFDLKKNENKLDLIVKAERKAKNDDVNDKVFQKHFRAFTIGANGYVIINQINPEIYLFSSSLGPYFVCMYQKQFSII